jgi:hypothetical protein
MIPIKDWRDAMDTTNPSFTVFGGSYIAERHNDNYRFDVDRRVQPNTGASWLVLCTLVAGISVFAAEIARFTSIMH